MSLRYGLISKNEIIDRLIKVEEWLSQGLQPDVKAQQDRIHQLESQVRELQKKVEDLESVRYEYNAPQYYDFSQEPSVSYFEVA